MHPTRTFGRPLLLAFLCCGLAATVASAADNTARGVANQILIKELQGIVEVRPPGAVDWVRTTTNQVLRPGFRLRTGPNSRGALLWSDSSVVPFGASTELEIRAPHQAGAESGLQLFRGIISFFHRDQPGRIRVITRGAAAGIKGTEFVVAVDAQTERATFSVIDGVIELRDLNDDQLLLTATNSEQVIVDPGQAPRRTAGFIAENVLQWCFYYPAVLDLGDLPLGADEQRALDASLAAYRVGDLLAALANYPNGRQPASEAERIYYAALLLSVGQSEQSEVALADLRESNSARIQQLAGALWQLIAAVKRQVMVSSTKPELATELLAASYYEQSRALGEESLERALQLARAAMTNSPGFSFAWARVAELEFSFGRTGKALEALEKSLALGPRNAQALALKGFLLAAQNRPHAAMDWFERALAVDSALGNAWMGRGLCRIRRGDLRGGREDLLIAAALEPRRASLRTYLGKAYGESNDRARALHELELAKGLDANDPTSWLYSALVKAEHNRINEAIRDLEKSQELNDNRSIYRSSLLLDQDRAVRSANLARIYADAGLADVALREASRAVVADYGNYSAHLFLANSYEEARRSRPYASRFETASINEYLLAALLGPADGRLLAQPVSQQEYSRLFERDTVGVNSSTEYRSHGAWEQHGVQYGTYRNTSYAVEGNYVSDPGQTSNREFELWNVSLKLKHQLTEKDGIFFEIGETWREGGDARQTYDPAENIEGRHFRERQAPTIYAGLNHRWSEAHHTLIFASHIEDSYRETNRHAPTFLLGEFFGDPVEFVPVDLTQQYADRLEVNSIELQHIASLGAFQTIAGIRLQSITERVFSRQTILDFNAITYESYFGPSGTVITNQAERLESYRISPYLYEHWQVADSLTLVAGLSYDYQKQPRNTLYAPVSSGKRVETQLSPKAGLVWTPGSNSAVRAAYSRSLNGVDLDESIRLEPAQVAGFVQASRRVAPRAVGGIAGAHSESYDVSIEQRFPSDTYVAVGGQWLHSTAEHDVGVFRREASTASGPGEQKTERFRFDERSIELSVHQLFGDSFAAGARYRMSEAELELRYPDVKPSFTRSVAGTRRGLLQVVSINGIVRHPNGFFAGAEATWWSQDLSKSLGGLSDDRFGQIDLFTGYRFPRRRAELTIGVLNATDRDYRLHPINLHPDLARERTFFTRLRLSF